MARRGAVLGAIDVGLEVLDAHAHREGLALHRHAKVRKQGKHVAGGVATGKHHLVGRDVLLHEKAAGLPMLQAHGPDAARPCGRGVHCAAILELDAHEPRPHADLAAKLGDAAAERVDHARQHVAADMGLCVPGDLGLGTGCHERVEHEAVQRALGARVELAVREGARAARAKLDVAFGVELARLVEAFHGLGAPCRVVAALHEQGLEPGRGQSERAEQTRAAGAHHHGPALDASRDAGGEHGGAGDDRANAARVSPAGEFGEQGPLGTLAAAQHGADGVGKVHGALLARVHGAAAKLHPANVAGGHVQTPQDRTPNHVALRLGRPVELREGDVQV